MSDLILTNANIVTMDPALPTAAAVAIRDGRILSIGSADEARAAARPGARNVELGGRTLTPGFNDCHMHILPYGLDLSKADLSPAAGVSDVSGLIGRLRQWCDENPQSEWALGSRYDQNTFPGARHPTRSELDAAFPDRPVFVMQTSKHAGAANSVALRLAGITPQTPDPDGGEIDRDGTGQPTGVLLESAVALVSRLIPQPDRAGLVAAIRRANEALVRVGITSASDLNTGWRDMALEIACYQQAAEEGAPVRTTLFPHAVDFGKPTEIPSYVVFARDCDAPNAGYWTSQLGTAVPPTRTNQVRIGPIKLFSDGALTVRTAAVREPFVDGSGSGMLLHPPDELKAYILEAHCAGWQIATHAIGDRAIELVLDAYQEAHTAAPRLETRHRIEHSMLADAGLVARFVAQQVIPVLQPEFISRLGDAYVLGLGEERAARLNPAASMQRAGLRVPFSSDCPIVPGAPLDGIRAAVRRTTRTGRLLGPDERISSLDALRNYTVEAAYSSFDEAETGTISPGKRADLTLLSHDLADETLDDLRVEATIIGGEVVYGELG